MCLQCQSPSVFGHHVDSEGPRQEGLDHSRFSHPMQTLRVSQTGQLLPLLHPTLHGQIGPSQ